MVDIIGGVVACVGVVDAALVVAEAIHDLVGDGDGPVLEHRVQQLILAPRSDVHGAAPHTHHLHALLEHACTIHCRVWILRLTRQTTIVIYVLESM